MKFVFAFVFRLSCTNVIIYIALCLQSFEINVFWVHMFGKRYSLAINFRELCELPQLAIKLYDCFLNYFILHLARWLRGWRHLFLSRRTPVLFLALTWWLTPVSHSPSRWFDIFIWHLQAPGMRVVHMHTCRKTLIHRK